jgi:hypothetical protein
MDAGRPRPAPAAAETIVAVVRDAAVTGPEGSFDGAGRAAHAIDLRCFARGTTSLMSNGVCVRIGARVKESAAPTAPVHQVA